MRTVLTPVRAPRANAIAERLVGTLRRECLDHVVIVSETHLRAVLTEFERCYNAERPHRSLRLAPPLAPHRDRAAAGARILTRPVLGGLHHVYDRAA